MTGREFDSSHNSMSEPLRERPVRLEIFSEILRISSFFYKFSTYNDN